MFIAQKYGLKGCPFADVGIQLLTRIEISEKENRKAAEQNQMIWDEKSQMGKADLRIENYFSNFLLTIVKNDHQTL